VVASGGPILRPGCAERPENIRRSDRDRAGASRNVHYFDVVLSFTTPTLLPKPDLTELTQTKNRRKQ
jgi:hypothetical protein